MSGGTFSLDGQAIVVVGAGGGIGESTVASVLTAGARGVLAADVRADAAAASLARLGDRARNSLSGHVDVTDPDSCERMIDRAREHFGTLDGLVVASGLSSMTLVRNGGPAGLSPVVATDVATMRDMMEVNYYGALHVNTAFARALLDEGRPGAIVNVTSIAARRVLPGNAAYSVSKAALRTLTKSLAVELAEHGIRVNAVAPGYVRTAMTAGADPRVITSVPLGRIAEPADVAPVITFLLSPASGYLTGAELVADGGVLAPYA